MQPVENCFKFEYIYSVELSFDRILIEKVDGLVNQKLQLVYVSLCFSSAAMFTYSLANFVCSPMFMCLHLPSGVHVTTREKSFVHICLAR